MPSVYTSSMSNVVPLMNQSDAKLHVQANTSFSTTTRLQNSTTRFYALTTPIPKGLSTTAIVCIVLAVIFVFILLCVVVFCLYRRKKRHMPPAVPTPIVPPVAPPVHRVKPPVKFRHTPTPTHPPVPLPVLPLLRCLKPLCREYISGLNLHEAYFDSHHDKCFCKKCHDPSNSAGKCGYWCKQKHGWVHFGLRVSQAHKNQWKIFREWKTSYYGTSSNLLTSVLSSRFVPFDGDKLNNGSAFNSGHPDSAHCTTSPSLRCASHSKFTSSSRFRARDGTNYNVQVVLQCKQKPDTYTIQGDGNFHNTEWATVTRGVLVPYGLLVRLQN